MTKLFFSTFLEPVFLLPYPREVAVFVVIVNVAVVVVVVVAVVAAAALHLYVVLEISDSRDEGFIFR